jgi:hypothetical protein
MAEDIYHAGATLKSGSQLSPCSVRMSHLEWTPI